MHRTIIVIGASTGGPEALKLVLGNLPRACAPVVIVQHMPPQHIYNLARSMDQISALHVSVAEDGVCPRVGQAFIAPGESHLKLCRDVQGRFMLKLDHSPPLRHHRPSVDVLFESAAVSAGANAIGVLLSGMGADGAAGLLAMRAAGALTIAQEESSCIVYGMPGSAVRRGAAREVLPPLQIAARLSGVSARSATDNLALGRLSAVNIVLANG